MRKARRWAHTVKWDGMQIAAACMAINHDGEYVMHDEYSALEAECERLSNELNNMRISWGLMQSEREAALKQVEGLRDDLRFLAEYITAQSAGNPLPNYLAIGRFPVDVARAALSAKP